MVTKEKVLFIWSIAAIITSVAVIAVSKYTSRFDVLIAHVIISVLLYRVIFKGIKCPIEFDTPNHIKRIEAASMAGVGSAIAVSILYFILWVLV